MGRFDDAPFVFFILDDLLKALVIFNICQTIKIALRFYLITIDELRVDFGKELVFSVKELLLSAVVKVKVAIYNILTL